MTLTQKKKDLEALGPSGLKNSISKKLINNLRPPLKPPFPKIFKKRNNWKRRKSSNNIYSYVFNFQGQKCSPPWKKLHAHLCFSPEVKNSHEGEWNDKSNKCGRDHEIKWSIGIFIPGNRAPSRFWHLFIGVFIGEVIDLRNRYLSCRVFKWYFVG